MRLTVKNPPPKCVEELFDGASLYIGPMLPITVVEFIEDNLRFYKLFSVGGCQLKNPREKVFEIRLIAPNEQGVSRVFLQIAGTQLAKGCPVKPLLIFSSVAAWASVRIVAKRVRRERGVEVLYGETKLGGFFHTLILPTQLS